MVDQPEQVDHPEQKVWLKPPRPDQVRVAVAGYLVVALLAVGAGLARLAGASSQIALLAGALLAGPIVVVFVGKRVTGIKAFSVEISLSEVSVTVEGDFGGSVMSVAEMGASAAPDLMGNLQTAIEGHAKLFRLNLRDDTYWWSTRLFLAAALADDYTEVDGFVFVRAGDQRHFVGIASPRAIRFRMAARFPAYEVAYRSIRSDCLAPPLSPDRLREVNEILTWRWGAALVPFESDVKQIVGAGELRNWLGADLDTEALRDGPLNALTRYRINQRSQRYTALTDGPRLAAIVDGNEIARRSTGKDLEKRLS
jgi:hypothetical protein